MYSDASSTGYGGYLEECNVSAHLRELEERSFKSSEMVHISGCMPPGEGYYVNITELEPP